VLILSVLSREALLGLLASGLVSARGDTQYYQRIIFDDSLTADRYYSGWAGAPEYSRDRPRSIAPIAFEIRITSKGTVEGIGEAPMVVMIENYRTGLIWKNVMQIRRLNRCFDASASRLILP
jgi:hypothetical protein